MSDRHLRGGTLRSVFRPYVDAVHLLRSRAGSSPLALLDAIFALVTPALALYGVAALWIIDGDSLPEARLPITIAAIAGFLPYGVARAHLIRSSFRHARAVSAITDVGAVFAFQTGLPSLRPAVPVGFAIGIAYASAWSGRRLGIAIAAASVPLTLLAQEIVPAGGDLSVWMILTLGGALATLALIVDVVTEEARFRSEEVTRVQISTLSHELRGPLATIAGCVQTVQTHWDRLDEATRSDFLGRIRSSVTEMEHMTDTLLGFARAATLLRISPVPLRLRDVLTDYVRAHTQALGDREIRLEVPPRLTVVADPDGLVRIIDNLIRNAQKYSPAETPITVTAMRLEHEVAVTVADEGIGISAELRQRVFDPFFQISASSGGVGLGLALVKRFVQLHGGRVWVDSEPGKGTTVGFTIPAPPSRAQVDLTKMPAGPAASEGAPPAPAPRLAGPKPNR